jgi:ADP-ribose pyrophosphatase YjhB (NUDIX family)
MLSKLILRTASFFRKTYWRFTRPIRLGVKVVAEYEGKILIVKNKYDKSWYLPGGGVRGGEALLDAAKRELVEECGVVVQDLKLIGVFSNFKEYKSDHIAVFSTGLADLPQLKKGIEIEECGFFDVQNLPERTSPATRRRIEDYRNGLVSYGLW